MPANELTTLARIVRTDIRTAIDHGTLTIPPCVKITVRVDRRGLMPSVNVYFGPDDDTATDDLNAWKYTTVDTDQIVSDAARTAATRILAMIHKRCGGNCCGTINGHGTIVAILTPDRTK
jgi:hypothetical protein